MLFEDKAQFVLVELAFDGADQFSLNLLLGVTHKGTEDIFADGKPRCTDVFFRLYLQQSPVIIFGHTKASLYTAVFVGLGDAVFIQLGSNDKFFHLTGPVGLLWCRTVIYHSVFEHDIVPRVLTLLVARVHYVNNLKGIVLLFFCVVRFRFFATRLVVAALLVEVEEYPCQLLTADSLVQGLAPQIIYGPVVGYLHASLHHVGMLLPEYLQHLVI